MTDGLLDEGRVQQLRWDGYVDVADELERLYAVEQRYNWLLQFFSMNYQDAEPGCEFTKLNFDGERFMRERPIHGQFESSVEAAIDAALGPNVVANRPIAAGWYLG